MKRISELAPQAGLTKTYALTMTDLIINYADNDYGSRPQDTKRISAESLGNSIVGAHLNNSNTVDEGASGFNTNRRYYVEQNTNGKLMVQVPWTDTIPVTSVAGKTGAVTLTNSDVGLGNVENKNSATIRSELTSSNITTALGYTPVNSSVVGSSNGIATLDSNGLVPTSQLPSYVDDVIEGYLYNNKFYTTDEHNTEITGEGGKIYIDLTTNSRQVYRWGGSAFAAIPIGLALGNTSDTAYRGDYGAAAYTHATDASRLTTAQNSGLYKVAISSEGHISSVTAVEKSDITGLGIPGQDTTYSTGSEFTSGLTKLYTSYGSGTDGAITQNTFTVLMANMIVNFGLTVALPSAATITENTTTGVLTVNLSGLNENCTTVIQKKGTDDTWTAYTEGDSWAIGDIFRVYVTRTVTIGASTFTNSGVIGNNHTTTTEWAPTPEEP